MKLTHNQKQIIDPIIQPLLEGITCATPEDMHAHMQRIRTIVHSASRAPEIWEMLLNPVAFHEIGSFERHLSALYRVLRVTQDINASLCHTYVEALNRALGSVFELRDLPAMTKLEQAMRDKGFPVSGEGVDALVHASAASCDDPTVLFEYQKQVTFNVPHTKRIINAIILYIQEKVHLAMALASPPAQIHLLATMLLDEKKLLQKKAVTSLTPLALRSMFFKIRAHERALNDRLSEYEDIVLDYTDDIADDLAEKRDDIMRVIDTLTRESKKVSSSMNGYLEPLSIETHRQLFMLRMMAAKLPSSLRGALEKTMCKTLKIPHIPIKWDTVERRIDGLYSGASTDKVERFLVEILPVEHVIVTNYQSTIREKIRQWQNNSAILSHLLWYEDQMTTLCCDTKKIDAAIKALEVRLSMPTPFLASPPSLPAPVTPPSSELSHTKHPLPGLRHMVCFPVLP